MRTARRTTTLTAATASLLLAGSAPGLAGADGRLAYAAGSAQVVARRGVALLEQLTLTGGTRDARRGRITLRYAGPDRGSTLSITVPATPGAHATARRAPRGASVRYRKLRGLAGQRGGCTIAWAEIGPTTISGSFSCPRERAGRKTRYALAGAFAAHATSEATSDPAAPDASPEASAGPSVAGGPGPAGMPIYLVGVPVSAGGDRLTPLGFADAAVACVVGRGPGGAPCPDGSQPVTADLRAIVLEVCAGERSAPLRLVGAATWSRSLFSGTPEAPLPAGVPAALADPAVAGLSLAGVVVDVEGCATGHVLAGTRGPLVVWLPGDGSSPVGWTLDPVALPPTATAPPPEGPGGSPSPTPVATPAPAGRTTYASGSADLLHDGGGTFATDALALTEGWLESDGAGGGRTHLAFADPAGATLAIDLPGGPGDHAIAADVPASGSLAYRVGDAAAAAGTTACAVELDSTDQGGLSGTYVCSTLAGGSASGAFIVLP